MKTAGAHLPLNSEPNKKGAFAPFLFYLCRVLSAAAEYENYSYNDEPDVAVVEKVTKTVIHKINPP